jgi:hypothetical protein
VSAKGWHASTRVPRSGACVQATDRLDAPRGRRTRPPCSAAVASSSERRSENVRVPADPSSWRLVDLVVGPREGWERSRPSVDAMVYLSDAPQMDVMEQGVTELVVRISKGTVTPSNRPPGGWAAVRCRTSSPRCSGIDASAALVFRGSHRSLTSTVSSHTL